MAVIGKIRSKSALLFGVIGAAMVLFILGDLLNSGGGFLRNQNNVGEIWGEDISYAEFDALVQQRIGSNSVNEQQRESIRDQVWSSLLQDRILFKEYERLGIDATAEEILFEIKNNPRNEVLMQYFSNPQTGNIFEQFIDPATGGLSSNAVLSYMQQLINSGQDENWDPLEAALISNRKANKYNNLIKFGLNITKMEVAINHLDENRSVRFRYAIKDFASIPNEEGSYDESDLKSYYNAHKSEAEYKQEVTTRAISYLSFPVTPTTDDYNAIQDELASLTTAYREAEDDTTFLNEFSDVPFNFNMYGEDDLPEGVDSLIFNSDTGSVFGPYEWRNQLHISKVIEKVTTADSVQARHILITWGEKDSSVVRNRVDSLFGVVKEGKDFASLAESFSEDFGSSNKGGDLGWFGRGRMVPPFEKAAFETKKDEFVVVESQYGVHLINVTDRSTDVQKVVLGEVSREVLPSEQTFEDVFNKASEFSITNNNIESFKAAIEADESLNLEEIDFIKEEDRTLGNFESPRTKIRWIYDSELGAVSEVYTEASRFVIMSVTSVKNQGSLDFENVREAVEQKVLAKKKAEKILSGLGSFANFDEAAQELGGNVESVDGLTFSEFSIPGLGQENNLFGRIFAFAPGQVSKPIVGERGVLVVEVLEFTDPLQEPDFAQSKVQLRRSLSERVDFEAFTALQSAVNVVDNRYLFY
jgi:peptidyl-prolyl cis-trans isomerase D